MTHRTTTYSHKMFLSGMEYTKYTQQHSWTKDKTLPTCTTRYERLYYSPSTMNNPNTSFNTCCAIRNFNQMRKIMLKCKLLCSKWTVFWGWMRWKISIWFFIIWWKLLTTSTLCFYLSSESWKIAFVISFNQLSLMNFEELFYSKARHIK